MRRTAEKGCKGSETPGQLSYTHAHTYIYIYAIYLHIYIYYMHYFLGATNLELHCPGQHKPFCSVAMDSKKRKTKTQRFDLFADQAYEREVHQQRFMDDDLEAGDRSIPVLLAFAALVYQLRF